MIITNRQLTYAQMRDLHALSSKCKKIDKGLPTIYKTILQQERMTDNNVLFYNKKTLIGFLSIYFFYQDACEISILVAPAFRRKKIASRMLQVILPLAEFKGMKNLIFSTTPNLNDAWLLKENFTYKNSEHHMELNNKPIKLISYRLNLRAAKATDIPVIKHLDHTCFKNPSLDLQNRLRQLLVSDKYKIIIAEFNQHVIGKAHINFEVNKTLLSDICILPEFQNQGFGKELVVQVLNDILKISKKQIVLDVESDNTAAINLYLHCGFKIKHIHDYWQIDLKELQKKLSK